MKKGAIIFFLLFFILAGQSKAQPPHCQTYTCYLCIWGPPLKIEVPNIFSPNEDGINDFWRPEVVNETCLGTYSVVIFNREGQPLFESDIYDEAWHGRNAANGAYYYIIRYTNGYSNNEYYQKGIIYVTR